MKKITAFLGMLTTLLFVVQAQAIQLGKYQSGLLVPTAYFNDNGVDTQIGLICQFTCTDNNATVKKRTYERVHWTFFDIDSKPLNDGYIDCSDDDLVSYSWKEHAGWDLAEKDGYLVFHAPSGVKISANAFLVDLNRNDAIFIPVVPLKESDFGANDAIEHLTYGIPSGTKFALRYWVDPTYQGATTLVIWLTDPYIKDKKAVTMHLNVFDDEENIGSFNLTLPHELNKICISSTTKPTGFPSNFNDGFIHFVMPASIDGFAYSYVSSSVIGATQTLLAAECRSGNSTQMDANKASASCCAY